MKKRNWLIVLLCLFAAATANSATNFQVGVATDDFAVSVGDYDYLPYYGTYPSAIGYYDALSEYGTWVSVAPFGRTWRPYVDSGWRPYVYGHWTTTNYGQTWVGYEPWAWMAYHYGRWVWTRTYGWVWIPGYEYSPANVVWGYTDYHLGWMPAPPYGYDYSLGYLAYRGSAVSFSFTSGYDNLFGNLWVFVDRDRYFYDNYAGYLVSTSSVRRLFQRRAVRLSTRPLRREIVERITGRRVRVIPVRERSLRVDGRSVKTVAPVGEEVRIRKNARTVVAKTIEPAFKERKLPLNGAKRAEQARNQQAENAKKIREAKLKSDRAKAEKQESVRGKAKITPPQKSTAQKGKSLDKAKPATSVGKAKASTVRKNPVEREKPSTSKSKATSTSKPSGKSTTSKSSVNRGKSTTLKSSSSHGKSTTTKSSKTTKSPVSGKSKSTKSSVSHGKSSQKLTSRSDYTRDRKITKSKPTSHSTHSVKREPPKSSSKTISRKPTKEKSHISRYSTHRSTSKGLAHTKQTKRKPGKPH
jgi:hypothetical protein